MPITYRIDTVAGLLLVDFEGVINQSARLETIQAWLADPDFRPGLSTLCDLSIAWLQGMDV